MKRQYLQPQILKYQSLQDITLQASEEMTQYPACSNQGSGCSGSCTIYADQDHPNWIGYKNSCP